MFTELTPQQTKALNFEKSISLKANAGSGKTLVLAKRYLQIAVNGNVPLQRIAAITFTDKAAGELYKRIAEEIQASIASTSNEKEIHKLEKIRRQLVSANISTIHSFCINVLKEFPVDAELDANFTPIDQNTSNELIELSVEETINKKLEDQANEECRYLIRSFGSKANLAKQLMVMINHRKIVTGLSRDIYNRKAEDIAVHFRNTFIEYFEIVFGPLIESVVIALNTINETVLNSYPQNEIAILSRKLINDLTENDDIADQIIAFQKTKDIIFTRTIKIKSRGYLPSKLKENLQNEIKVVELFFNEIKNLSLSESSKKTEIQLAITGIYLIHLFDDIIFIYDQKKHEKGFLDYEDILLKTRNLLQSDTSLKQLSQKFDFLMVDEYQDTNEIQYEIFMPLLDYLKRGNLFVVGDEKQSIYRFREAELEVFEKTNADIINSSGQDSLITLPDSFRMEPVISLFTNVLFQKLFEKPDKLFNEVEHSDLVCAKPGSNGGEVSILLADEENEISESELVSIKILSLIKEKKDDLNWKDIAILVRKRSAFKELEKRFVEYKIPYRIIGGRGFFQRQSIYDIYNYFSFLLDTNNDAALAGILRSPFYSLSDLKLYEISLNPGKSFWEKLQNSINADEELESVVSKLRNDLSRSNDRDFNKVLRIIFENTNFISVLASRPDGEQEIANIEKLHSLTNSFLNHGFKTLYDYVDFLKDAIYKIADEAQAGLTDQAAAVNILTIHQAKGLEFPAVFLYKCHETSREDIVKSKSISIDKNFGILTKVPEENNHFSDYKQAPIIVIRDYIESRKNLAEVKRLFYVGVTRAKQYLYLTASSKDGKFPGKSFMGLMIESLKLNVNETKHIIEGNLNFLVKENEHFTNIQKEITYTLSVVKEINYSESIDSGLEKPFLKKKFMLDSIKDVSKGEIISATKVAAYMQCPLKYNLIYKYGYSPLYSEFRKESTSELIIPEFNILREEDSQGNDGNNSLTEFSDIKGQIIHKILQQEVDNNQLEQFITEETELYSFSVFNKTEVKSSFIKDTLDMVSLFYDSEEFVKLNSLRNYKNEAEIYLKENDYYLYGIIDKLIIDGDKIIVVDYKTDDIQIESVKNRANYYLNQLNFYANIVSKLHKDVHRIQIRIIFLKHPNNTFCLDYDSDDIRKIEQEIYFAIEGIRSNDSTKNLSHCRECSFSSGNRCII